MFNTLLRPWGIAFSAFLLLAACSSICADDLEKLPRPGPGEAAKAQKEITDAFGADIEKATTPAAKKALATKMLGFANDVKETPSNRWRLYIEVRELAVAAGEPALAASTIADQERAFVMSRQQISIDAIDGLAKTTTSANSKPLIDLINPTVAAAIAEDDYTTALRLLELGVTTSRRLKDSPIIKHFETQLRKTQESAKLYEAARKAKDDESLGKFYCFRKDDWGKGLPLLAKSKEEALAAVVNSDLRMPGDGKDRCAVGDAWFEIAEKASG